MRRVFEWIHRLLGTVRPRRHDDELAAELRAHVELEAEAARQRGLDAAMALRAATIRAGGVSPAMETLRDQRGVPVISGMTQDVRLAMRSLRAAPIVTAGAVLSLGLAIGANTAIFSILNSLVLRPLPVREPSRLVHVTDSVVRENGETRVRAWSYPAWLQIREQRLFESATAWTSTRFDLGDGGEIRPVDGVWADGSFFETLGIPAILGRTFSRLDDRPGGGPDGAVVVIGYGFWQRQFGGSADAVGRSLRLNGVPFTIVGVTPREFFGIDVGRAFDVVVPLGAEPLVNGRDSLLESAATSFLGIVARLRPGQSTEAATADLRRIQPEVRQSTAGPWERATLDRYLTAPFTVVPASTGSSILRENYARPVVVLTLVVVLVLLIGCVNLANLLLARASARRHELSVQVAIGAPRWRLARQLFLESAVLAGAGALLGMLIAGFGGRFLVRQLSSPLTTVFLDLSLDGRVLGFTIVLTAVTALLFGTAPALRAAGVQPRDALNDRHRASTAGAHGRVMGVLIPLQVGLSLLLLVGAGLFSQSFLTLTTRDLGFRPDGVLVVTMDAVRANIDRTQRVSLYERTLDAALQLPDVADAAISFRTPGSGGGFTPAIEISAAAAPIQIAANGDVFGNLISPGWFSTFSTHVVAGREFTAGDRAGSPGVAIVNETFARRLGDTSPLGRTLTIYPNTPRALQMQIVGIAADAVYGFPRDPVPPTWYIPIAQSGSEYPFESARLSVRSSGAPLALTEGLGEAIAAVHPRLALTFRPLDEQLRASLTRERLMAQLAGSFATLALLLTALGLYGITAYAVARRRAEIGIRLALGATPGAVVRAVLGRMSVLVGAGLLAGAAVSVWASRFVERLIYGLPARDLSTLSSALVLLAAVGAVAGWLPARRAARVNAVTALRES